MQNVCLFTGVVFNTPSCWMTCLDEVMSMKRSPPVMRSHELTRQIVAHMRSARHVHRSATGEYGMVAMIITMTINWSMACSDY